MSERKAFRRLGGVVVEQALTPERWEAYLQGIRQTGLKRASARAASPHASPKTGAYSTFICAERNDPVKRAEVEEAMAEFNERLQAEVVRRAVEGLPEKLFQAGKLMRDENGQPVVVRRYSDRLLERLLEARMPTTWTPGRSLRGDLRVTHASEDTQGVVLRVEDFRSLSLADREAMAKLLRKVSANRAERDGAIDGEYEEVPDEEDQRSEPPALGYEPEVPLNPDGTVNREKLMEIL